MSVLKEFRDFVARGNVVDLAVAVVIGGAFGKIVTSFVNDVIMPPIGVLTGGVDFGALKMESSKPANRGPPRRRRRLTQLRDLHQHHHPVRLP